ncbi:hypothetical protein LXL04_016678 [Taraxacum kok-saghyz]
MSVDNKMQKKLTKTERQRSNECLDMSEHSTQYCRAFQTSFRTIESKNGSLYMRKRDKEHIGEFSRDNEDLILATAGVVCDKKGPPEPEAEVVEPVKVVEEEKITESASFKEESNVAGELPDPQKKALDELEQLVQEALNKHEFTAPPVPVKEEAGPVHKFLMPWAKNEEKPAAAVEEEGKACDETAVKEEATPEPAAAAEASEAVVEGKDEKAVPPTAETSAPVVECKEEEKPTLPPPAPVGEVPEPVKEVTEVVEKVETCAEEDGAKKIEAIEETIVAVATSSEPPKTEETEQTAPETATEVTPAAPPPPPEEVSIWGIPLLALIQALQSGGEAETEAAMRGDGGDDRFRKHMFTNHDITYRAQEKKQ